MIRFLVLLIAMPFLACENNPAQSGKGKNHQLPLLHFDHSECDASERAYSFRDSIVSKKITGDTLTMQIAFAENCCIHFFPAISLRNDTLDIVLDERKQEERELCDCICCWEIEFSVRDVPGPDFTTLLSGKVIED